MAWGRAAAVLLALAIGLPAAGQTQDAPPEPTPEPESAAPDDATPEPEPATPEPEPDTEPLDLSDLDFTALGLEDELALLAEEDIVVSASRRLQYIDDSPATITVITREEILASGYGRPIDLMRLVPGADPMIITEGLSELGIRTGTTEAGDLVLMLVDGRDVALTLFGQPLWSALPIDVRSIERIEVIRGPGSTLYGANALQGVVNVVTRAPSERPLAAEAILETPGGLGRRGEARVHGTLGRLGYWVSGGYEQWGQFTEPSVFAGEVYRGRARGTYRLSESARLDLELGASTIQSPLFTTIGSGTASAVWPYGRFALRSGRTEVQLVLDVLRSELDLDFGLRLPPSPTTPSIDLAIPEPIIHNSQSAVLQGTHHWSLLETLELGVGATAAAMRHHGGSFVDCPPVDDPQTFDAAECSEANFTEARIGAFAQAEWQALEQLTATAGLRVDVNTFSPEAGLSPRLAVVYRPVRSHALRLSAGRAYRKPNFLEARGHLILRPAPGVSSDLAKVVETLFVRGGGAEGLQNQKATSLEAGWRGEAFDGKLTGTLDAHYSWLTDAIFFDPSRFRTVEILGVPTIPTDAVVFYANSTEPDTGYGFEATAAFRPTSWVQLVARYGYEQTFETRRQPDGSVVRGEATIEPDHRVSGSLRLRSPWGLGLAVDAIWFSLATQNIPDPESAVAPRLDVVVGGQTMVNLNLRYVLPLGDHELEAGLRVYNLLDAEFRDFAGLETEAGVHAGRRLPRQLNVYLGGRY